MYIVCSIRYHGLLWTKNTLLTAYHTLHTLSNTIYQSYLYITSSYIIHILHINPLVFLSLVYYTPYYIVLLHQILLLNHNPISIFLIESVTNPILFLIPLIIEWYNTYLLLYLSDVALFSNVYILFSLFKILIDQLV